MGYFLFQRLESQRIDLLVFAGHPHSDHSSEVQLARLLGGPGQAVEAVQDEQGLEKRLFVTLIRRQHFHHPVHHLSPQFRSHLVLLEEGYGGFVVLQVVEYVLAVGSQQVLVQQAPLFFLLLLLRLDVFRVLDYLAQVDRLLVHLVLFVLLVLHSLTRFRFVETVPGRLFVFGEFLPGLLDVLVASFALLPFLHFS